MAEEKKTHGDITNNFYNVVNKVVNNYGTLNEYGSENFGKEERAYPAYESAKESILQYVDRLTPIVKDEYKDCYIAMWEGLLELKEVKQVVYKRGKQQDTSFNRNLVAQIIHQIKEKIYVPSANAKLMAECLEPGKGGTHSVRQKLGESPDKLIKKSVEEYFATHYNG